MQRSRSRKNTRLFRTLLSCVLSIVCCMGVFLCNSFSSSAEVSTFRKYDVSPLYSYLTFNSGLYTFSPEPDEIHVWAAKGTNYHFQFNTKYQLSLDAPYGVASVERIDYILSFEWTSFYNQTIFDSICLYFKIGDYSFRFDNDRFIDFSYKTDFKRDIDGNILDYNTRVYTLDFSFDPTGFSTPMTGNDYLWISINCIDRYYSDSDEATDGYFTFTQQYLAVQYTQKEYEDVREEQLDDVNSNLSDMNSNFDDVNSNLGDVNSNLEDLQDSLTSPSSDVSSNVDDFEASVNSGIDAIMDQEQSWQDSVDAIYESYGIDPDSLENRFSNVIADLRLEVSSDWLSDLWGFLKEYKFLYLFLNTGLVFCMIVFLLRR